MHPRDRHRRGYDEVVEHRSSTAPSVTAVVRPDGLPAELTDQAAGLLAVRGVGGFSVREVARRAGVTHAAVTHHFGSARGLLTTVAVAALQYLADETRTAADDASDAVDACGRVGHAYVRVSVAHPGHSAVVFRPDVVDVVLATSLAWAALQGLVGMYGPITKMAADHGRAPEPMEQLAERFTRVLADAIGA